VGENLGTKGSAVIGVRDSAEADALPTPAGDTGGVCVHADSLHGMEARLHPLVSATIAGDAFGRPSKDVLRVSVSCPPSYSKKERQAALDGSRWPRADTPRCAQQACARRCRLARFCEQECDLL
jgi:hypothetical protein